MYEQNLKSLYGVMLVGVIVLASFVYAVNIQPVVSGIDYSASDFKIKNFESYSDLAEYLMSEDENQYSYNFGSGMSSRMLVAEAMDDSAVSKNGGEVVDWSQTNVQVTGVDEPDVVKTDGTYLYVVSNNRVLIIDAVPAEDAEIITEISFDESVRNIFISGDRLVVFCEDYNYDYGYILEDVVDEVQVEVAVAQERWFSSTNTKITVFDLTDIRNPETVREVTVSGSYSGSRLIEDYAYVISTQYSYDIRPYEENEIVLPGVVVDGVVRNLPLEDIHYVDMPEKSKTITNIVSINIHDEDVEVNQETFFLGNTQILYVNTGNIYIAYSTQYYDYDMLFEIFEEVLMPYLPDDFLEELELVESLTLEDYQKTSVTEWILQNYAEMLSEDEKQEIANEIVRRTERTIIHRISIEDGEIEYAAQGNVPGFLENQFQLNQHDGHLRVSTTTRGWMISRYIDDVESKNNVYVLDMDLDIVGSLEDLAPGEQIYATRFLGDRCYLVTFRQVDPFFVIDLSSPTNPKVMGELKIPGFSKYLHPYDDSHIIGIGQEDGEVKISLFEVTDPENPIEVAKYAVELGENSWGWSTSEALNEHKAFLFDYEKNLLVIPVGNWNKQDAYVFDISTDGISLKGTVSHEPEEPIGNEKEDDFEDDYYYPYYEYGYSIKRTLYIGDVLYTFSDKMVKMNSLDDLGEINSITLVNE